MKDQDEQITESTEESEKTSSPAFGKLGKVFLIIGIVLVQAAGSYALVSGFYPEISKFTAGFESEGGVYYTIENIIINPAESNGERYLIMSITVELNGGGVLEVLNTKKAEVLDRINTVMSNYTAEQLGSLENRDSIKKQVGIVINDIVNKKSVRNLFFTKYVLQ